MQKKLFHTIVIGCKLILGVGLLGVLLFWGDNLEQLMALASSIGWMDVLVLCLISLVLNWISCLKWDLFLKERGFRISQLRLLGLYYIGKFFSNFVPTTIGGDLTRTFLLGRQINSQSQSFASVFLERVTGFAALMIVAVVFAAINPKLLGEPKITISISLFSMGFLGVVALVLSQSLVNHLAAMLGHVVFVSALLDKVRKVQRDILFFKGRPVLLCKAMAYSFTFHLFACVNVYAACMVIGFYPSFLDIAVITPIILLLNVLPVSPNNIGWWEWTFSFLLVEAGSGPAEGLAVGLILRFITLLSSLAGGVVFLFERDRKGDMAHDQRTTNAAQSDMRKGV